METDNLTAQELAARAMRDNPAVIYRAAADGNSVAAWHNGEWVPVAGRLIGRLGWASITVRVLVDGRPAFDAALYGPAPEAR